MSVHPDLEAEQAYLDHAYVCVEASRKAAAQLGSTWDVGSGGTYQARFERDVMVETMSNRLAELDFGDAALCFGRIDTAAPAGASPNGSSRPPSTAPAGAGSTYYIGRVAVSDDNQDVVVVDWRAPVAEPFYRATGRDPLGLVRRRHFSSRGRTLLGIDDELFGELAAALDEVDEHGRRKPIQGYGALISALETARSGRLSDIVGTIQAEQDEIIRSPMAGVLVVQGGPGTGKTVVALHRAAYLLYTHRFPLQGQGVLVVGPNRLFLNYIEQVLPSLGEAGVEQVVLSDLIPEARVGSPDEPVAARVKGDLRMVDLLGRAVAQRERPLRADLEVGLGLQVLRVTVADSRRIVSEARRRFRRHNAGRRFVESELFATLHRSARREVTADAVRDGLTRDLAVREALEWMWPVLTPSELLNDLYGSSGLLRDAARGLLDEAEWVSLRRDRVHDAEEVIWAIDDVPVLDEARALLGAAVRGKGRPPGGQPSDDEVRTYGHIVVDEAQDLSPMQLRMLSRRSLNGSMTIVGDIAQATGAWSHADWDEILDLLPDRQRPRRAELTVGYRTPAPIMEVAARVLRVAVPDLAPPLSIRQDGDRPTFVRLAADQLGPGLADVVRREVQIAGPGSVGIICPGAMAGQVDALLTDAGVDHARATRHGLDQQVTVVPVGLVKGLELDSVVVVEPARIVAEEHQGMRALYVALTRATKRLAVVTTQDLPDALRE